MGKRRGGEGRGGKKCADTKNCHTPNPSVTGTAVVAFVPSRFFPPSHVTRTYEYARSVTPGGVLHWNHQGPRQFSRNFADGIPSALTQHSPIFFFFFFLSYFFPYVRYIRLRASNFAVAHSFTTTVVLRISIYIPGMSAVKAPRLSGFEHQESPFDRPEVG